LWIVGIGNPSHIATMMLVIAVIARFSVESLFQPSDNFLTPEWAVLTPF
jgi:hypothetical protein